MRRAREECCFIGTRDGSEGEVKVKIPSLLYFHFRLTMIDHPNIIPSPHNSASPKNLSSAPHFLSSLIFLSSSFHRPSYYLLLFRRDMQMSFPSPAPSRKGRGEGKEGADWIPLGGPLRRRETMWRRNCIGMDI